ncbi:hypothetical protein JTM51_31705, partial [Pseudomonas aeruginosa]|nr:hypothetical protein [Pseudomonas aeruginosa]
MLVRTRQGLRIAIRPRLGFGGHPLIGVGLGVGQRRRVAIGASFRFSIHQLLRVLVRARQGLRIAIRPGL